MLLLARHDRDVVIDKNDNQSDEDNAIDGPRRSKGIASRVGPLRRGMMTDRRSRRPGVRR